MFIAAFYIYIYIYIYIHIYTHTHTPEYCSAIKEGNHAISDNMDGHWEHCAKWSKSQRKTNTAWFHLCVESKKPKLIETENRLVAARDGILGLGEMSEGDQKVQTCSYKVNKF